MPNEPPVWKADDTTIPVSDRIRALKQRMRSAVAQTRKHADMAQSYADQFEKDEATLKELQGSATRP